MNYSDAIVEVSILFQYDDGGRKDAGFKGETGDCVCRAIAIATGLDYADVYQRINALGEREHIGKRKKKRSNARSGVYNYAIRSLMVSLGWTWAPCMFIGQGCKVHLRARELPRGRLLVSLSRHYVAVIDRVLHDLSRCDRHGTRCVYGYWSKPN